MSILKLKRAGDTLIEVMFAIAIFSLVAISVVSTMNSGTSSVQNNLETTMSRNAIDIQAEALRFIQSSYIAEHDSAEQNYSAVWKAITSLANKPEENIVKFSVNSCQELYDRNSPNSIYRQNAFIINTRGLTVEKDGVNTESAIIKAVDRLGDPNSKIFTTASVYPRIMFRGENDASLIDTNNSKLINSVEGIYVVAVRDPNSTATINQDRETDKTEKGSAYYDFYIRTCWSNSRSNSAPTTISTVIRLYDPDMAVVEDIKEYKYIDYSLSYDLNGGSWNGSALSTVYAQDVNSSHKFGTINITPPTRPGYTFLGWQISNDDNGQYDKGNKSYIKNAAKLLVEGDPITAKKDKPNITLYAVWGKLVNFTAATGDTERGTIKELKSAWYSKTYGKSMSGDNVTIQLPSGDNVIATPGPKQCFVFSDWYKGDSFYVHAIDGQVITEDTVVNAKFSKDVKCIDEIKVLNVYPSQANFKTWMESGCGDVKGCGKVNGKQVIKVTTTPIANFNSNPGQANNYDVIVFGFWDCNNNKDLSTTSKNWLLNNWINAGKPIVFGHDTIVTDACSSHPNFNALDYYAGVTSSGGTWAYGSYVKILKDSTFTTYPYNIKNSELNIPYAHSTGQRVLNTSNIFLSFRDAAANNANFYLVVNGTGSMINTGHSSGAATSDEQKILTNLIFYLYSLYNN